MTRFVWAVRVHELADRSTLRIFEAHTPECARAGKFPAEQSAATDAPLGTAEIIDAVDRVAADAGCEPASTYIGRCLRDLPKRCGPIARALDGYELELEAAYDTPALLRHRETTAAKGGRP